MAWCLVKHKDTSLPFSYGYLKKKKDLSWQLAVSVVEADLIKNTK
jgi:hypothetical protein